MGREGLIRGIRSWADALEADDELAAREVLMSPMTDGYGPILASRVSSLALRTVADFDADQDALRAELRAGGYVYGIDHVLASLASANRSKGEEAARVASNDQTLAWRWLDGSVLAFERADIKTTSLLYDHFRDVSDAMREELAAAPASGDEPLDGLEPLEVLELDADLVAAGDEPTPETPDSEPFGDELSLEQHLAELRRAKQRKGGA